MHLTLYEHNRGFVLQKLRQGEFDYIDTGDEVFESDFFRHIAARGILQKLAQTYPSPRSKTEVPVWLALGSSISMRLHGADAFNQYQFVVRCGGMMNALGPQLGHKSPDPGTGHIKLTCPGFNEKNIYPRDTPCDADFLRKFFRDTDAGRAEHWYNTEVARLFKKRHAYDRRGLFIGDGTYVFVPDNPKYQGASRLLFDEHNHPVDPKKLTPAQRQKGPYQWRRCYKLVTLLHLYPQLDCFLIVGFRLLPGKQNELPALYELMETFVATVGKGVVKRLILDRAFLDGPRMGHLKTAHGIDVLIPLRKNMDIYQDAMGLMGEVSFQDYQPPPPPLQKPLPQPVPETIAKREAKRRGTMEKKQAAQPPPAPDKQLVAQQVGVLGDFRSWSSCPVPLSVIYCRDTYADGHHHQWLLIDTARVKDPALARTQYRLRVQVEERYRQLKCFTDLMGFTSRRFSLVMHQVLTVLLTYSLVQLYLRKLQRAELSRKPLPNVRKELLPAASFVIVYCEGRVAFFDRLEYTESLLTLDEQARHKALARIQRLRRQHVVLRHTHGPP